MKELRTAAEVFERLSHNQGALRAAVEELAKWVRAFIRHASVLRLLSLREFSSFGFQNRNSFLLLIVVAIARVPNLYYQNFI